MATAPMAAPTTKKIKQHTITYEYGALPKRYGRTIAEIREPKKTKE